MTRHSGRFFRMLAIAVAHFVATIFCFVCWGSGFYTTPPDPYAGWRSAAGCCGLLLLIPFGPLLVMFSGAPGLMLSAAFGISLFWGWMLNLVVENWFESRSIRKQLEPETLDLSDPNREAAADAPPESQDG